MTHHRSSSLLVERLPAHYLVSPKVKEAKSRRVSLLGAAGVNIVTPSILSAFDRGPGPEEYLHGKPSYYQFGEMPQSLLHSKRRGGQSSNLDEGLRNSPSLRHGLVKVLSKHGGVVSKRKLPLLSQNPSISNLQMTAIVPSTELYSQTNVARRAISDLYHINSDRQDSLFYHPKLSQPLSLINVLEGERHSQHPLQQKDSSLKPPAVLHIFNQMRK